jgi:hypothetical protein
MAARCVDCESCTYFGLWLILTEPFRGSRERHRLKRQRKGPGRAELTGGVEPKTRPVQAQVLLAIYAQEPLTEGRG